MSSRTDLPSFSAAAQGDIVTIKVGPTAQYRVHKDLITPPSAYFERAFLNGIELKLGGGATDVDFFNIFVDWLYSRKIPAGLSQNVLLKAVVCGHFITAPAFEAAVHNILVGTLIAARKAPSHKDIIFIFDKLPADHALLELFVELHSYWGADTLEQLRANMELPFDFIRRVYDKSLKVVDVLTGNPLDSKACDFHVHANDQERWECVYGIDS
jgi:hypothetical protein